MNRPGRLIITFTSLLLFLATPALASVAGHVQFVSGNVVVESVNGNVRTIQKGDKVFAGETIKTGRVGSAQLRMVDHGFISVRPRTSLRIDEYRYEKSGRDSSFFSLLKGNFRALTGMIAKFNKSSWKTQTETAVLGVRGSDADIGFNPDNSLTAVRTLTGGYTLTPKDSSLPPLNVDAGGIGIFTPGAPPVMASSFPFEPPAPPPQPEAQEGESPDSSATEPSVNEEAPLPPPPTEVAGVAPQPSSSGATSTAAGSSTLGTADLLPVDQAALPVSTGTTVLNAQTSTTVTTVLGGPVPAKTGAGGVGAYVVLDTFFNPPAPWANSGSVVFDGTATKSGLISPSGQLLKVNTTTVDGAFAFDANTATHIAGATFSIPSLVNANVLYKGNWGVWSGNYTVVDFGAPQTPVGNFYYTWAENITTTAQIGALTGTQFTFAMLSGAAGNEIGSTASAFNVGATGTFGAAPTLGTVTVTGSANFPAGSTGWTFTGTGNIADLINENTGLNMSALCSTCSTSSGMANGQFAGALAEGLIMSVHTNDSVSGSGMVGSAVLKR